jgi:hypothetical protein
VSGPATESARPDPGRRGRHPRASACSPRRSRGTRRRSRARSSRARRARLSRRPRGRPRRAEWREARNRAGRTPPRDSADGDDHQESEKREQGCDAQSANHGGPRASCPHSLPAAPRVKAGRTSRSPRVRPRRITREGPAASRLADELPGSRRAAGITAGAGPASGRGPGSARPCEDSKASGCSLRRRVQRPRRRCRSVSSYRQGESKIRPTRSSGEEHGSTRLTEAAPARAATASSGSARARSRAARPCRAMAGVRGPGATAPGRA